MVILCMRGVTAPMAPMARGTGARGRKRDQGLSPYQKLPEFSGFHSLLLWEFCLLDGLDQFRLD